MSKKKKKEDGEMIIERLPLLEVLNTLKPAISSKNLIEELTHVWFDGEFATAYNDAELGIQVPLESPFKGGVQGALLLGLLTNSRAKEISMVPGDEGSMKMKLSRTKADLTVLDLERGKSMWTFPNLNKKHAIAVDEDFCSALRSVLISVGKDTTTPETLGVTFVKQGDALHLYTTDTASVATIKVPLPDGFKQMKGRRVIPAAFCEQVLRLCEGGGQLEFANDYVVALSDSNVLIYSRPVEAPKPLPMADWIEKAAKYPKSAKFKVPERLSLALDRMQVMFEGKPGEVMTVQIGDGLLKMSASVQGKGDLKDSVPIPDNVPPVTFRTEPRLIKRAMGLATEMVCTEDSVRMSGDNDFIYLISNPAV